MRIEIVTGSGSGGGGNAPNGSLASNVVSIAQGATSKAVLYSSTLAQAGVPLFSFINTTDASPIFLQGMITAYSTTGFTVTFNAPTDTANYSLAYANFEGV